MQLFSQINFSIVFDSNHSFNISTFEGSALNVTGKSMQLTVKVLIGSFHVKSTSKTTICQYTFLDFSEIFGETDIPPRTIPHWTIPPPN